jgi:hypothetical protein
MTVQSVTGVAVPVRKSKANVEFGHLGPFFARRKSIRTALTAKLVIIDERQNYASIRASITSSYCNQLANQIQPKMTNSNCRFSNFNFSSSFLLFCNLYFCDLKIRF